MYLPRFAWALLLGLPAVAHADIYACTGKTGMTVYQNFACEIDSIGSKAVPTQEPRAPSAKGMTTAHALPSERATPISGSTLAAAPRIGMSTKEVRTIWGDPANVYHDELVDGRVEIWTYPGSRSVQFNPHGRAVAIDQPRGGS